MNRLSDVVLEIGRPGGYGRRDAFVAAAAGAAFLLEAIGPIAGYPTVTGWLYVATGVTPAAVAIWQLTLLLIPQGLLAAYSGLAFSRSTWGRWIATRVKGNAAIVLPELHVRESAWGVVAAVTVWLLATIQRGTLPAPRYSLVVAEAFALTLALVVIVLGLVLRSKRQYHITETEDQILWVLPQAAMPTEIVLDRTAFLKSIVLRVVPGGYAFADAQAPIRLDEGGFVILNLGVLEAMISVPLQARSANALQASAQLHVSVSGAARRDVLQREAVDFLLNNLYTKPDLVELLTSQFSLAMDDYAGEFDATVKNLTEAFHLGALRGHARSAGERLAIGTSPLAAPDATVTDLELMRDRVEARLCDLERFQQSWRGARRLQERGKSALPPVFDARMSNYFRRQMGDHPERTWTSAAALLNVARITVLVSEVTFTDRALEAEQMLTRVTEGTMAELRAAETALSAARVEHGHEIRALLDKKMADIDPRLMMTPRGVTLFHRLMGMRMAEWDERIATEITEVRRELGALPDTGTPPELPAVRRATLRVGRGLAAAPAVRDGEVVDPETGIPSAGEVRAAAAPSPSSVTVRTELRVGRTSREIKRPVTATEPAAPDEEPM